MSSVRQMQCLPDSHCTCTGTVATVTFLEDAVHLESLTLNEIGSDYTPGGHPVSLFPRYYQPVPEYAGKKSYRLYVI